MSNSSNDDTSKEEGLVVEKEGAITIAKTNNKTIASTSTTKKTSSTMTKKKKRSSKDSNNSSQKTKKTKGEEEEDGPQTKNSSIVGESMSAKQCESRAAKDKGKKDDQAAIAHVNVAIEATLKQAAALGVLREKIAKGAQIDEINHDLFAILSPKRKARSEGGGDPDKLDGDESIVKPDHESNSSRVDEVEKMEEPRPAEGEEPEQMIVSGISSDVVGMRGYCGMGSMMSMGMEVLNVFPSGMVLNNDVVGYIVGSESGETYVNYYYGGTGCYKDLYPAGIDEFHSVTMLKKLETRGIDGTAHIVHSMIELEKCKEELKNAQTELSQWKSGAVKSIEVYDVDKEVSTYDNSGPFMQREAGASSSSMHLILQTTNTLVKVKKEKFQAESQLANALEDLEDTQETLGQQVVFTDSWQGRFDELAILAEAAGVDKVQVYNIRNRSFVAGTKCAQNYE